MNKNDNLLKDISGQLLDLSKSSKFLEHSKHGHSYACVLIDQINSGFCDRFFKNKKDLVVLDIGANVGLWSLYIRPICKLVVAFEPTPSHNEIAQELLDLYDNPTKIILAKSALSNKDGYENFNIGTVNSTMNSFVKHYDHNQSVEVKTCTLKTIVENVGSKIDFIKLDIEGAEQSVILDDNFDKEIYNNVESMFVEVHVGLGADWDKIWAKLSSIGYKLEKINSDGIYCYK